MPVAAAAAVAGGESAGSRAEAAAACATLVRAALLAPVRADEPATPPCGGAPDAAALRTAIPASRFAACGQTPSWSQAHEAWFAGTQRNPTGPPAAPA